MSRTLQTTLAALFAVFVFQNGGQVEGFLFPVATNTTITKVEQDGKTSSRVWGTFRKRRDCSFSGIEWRFNTGGRFTVAPVIFEEGTRSRPRGWEDFGAWLVGLTPEQIEQSQVVVFHECHSLWRTQTRFYP